MSIADRKLKKRREMRSAKENDYSVKLFLIGWVLFLILGITLFWSTGFATLFGLKKIFGQPMELEYIGYAYIAFYSGLIGYLIGQIISILIMKKVARGWRGNLRFGVHPVRNIILSSLITFNILFILLLNLIFSFKS